MFDLALKLVDNLIKLAEAREKNRRRLYDDFVRPAYADFEALHESYVARLQKYRAMVEDPQFPLDSHHPVLQLIRDERAVNQGLKYRVSQLERYESHQQLGLFMRSIGYYLNCISLMDVDSGDGTTVTDEARGQAMDELDDGTEGRRRRVFSPATLVEKGLRHIFIWVPPDGLGMSVREYRVDQSRRMFMRAFGHLNFAFERVAAMEMRLRDTLLAST
jgi:hypothetical protein